MDRVLSGFGTQSVPEIVELIHSLIDERGWAQNLGHAGQVSYRFPSHAGAFIITSVAGRIQKSGKPKENILSSPF